MLIPWTNITRGTTNVFADLGYPDAAERQTKTRLALAVNELLKARKLKQREIGTLLGANRPAPADRFSAYRVSRSQARASCLPPA